MTITYPDPLPFKLRILKGLTDALKEITVANGYETDLADLVTYEDPMADPLVEIDREGSVFRGRAWFGDSDSLPMVSVLEGVSPADEVAEPPIETATSETDWPILIQGFVNDDPVNPTDPAYVLLADVRRRLAIEKKRKLFAADKSSNHDVFGLGLGSRLLIQSIGSGVVRPADDVSSKAYFWLTLVLRIVDKAENPYV